MTVFFPGVKSVVLGYYKNTVFMFCFFFCKIQNVYDNNLCNLWLCFWKVWAWIQSSTLWPEEYHSHKRDSCKFCWKFSLFNHSSVIYSLLWRELCCNASGTFLELKWVQFLNSYWKISALFHCYRSCSSSKLCKKFAGKDWSCHLKRLILQRQLWDLTQR